MALYNLISFSLVKIQLAFKIDLQVFYVGAIQEMLWVLSGMSYHQLLIKDIMLHYTCILWTLLAHKIALNRSFPTILLALNLAQWLWSYSQNTD